MIAALTALADRLVIPSEWYDTIIAHVLTADGLVEFKRQSQELRRLQSTAHPIVAQVLPLLKDFPALWQQLMAVE